MTSEEEFIKFLETRKRKINQDNTDLKKLKSEILSSIEESQSFEGILSELSDNGAENSLDDVDIAGEFIVSDCISLLKSKARQASCSLDLLAAELMSKKLLKAINSCCDGQSQFLNNKQKAATSTIVMIIKTLLKDNSFNRVHFAKCLSSEQQDNVLILPLEVLWILHTSHITSFNTYLACCSYNTVTCSSFVKGMVELFESSPSDKHSQLVAMLSVFLSVLLPLAYKEKTSSNEKRTNLEKVAENILQNVINDTTGSSSSSKESSDEVFSRIDIFEVVRHTEDVPQSTVSKFFNEQLHRLLFAPTKCSEVSFAVKNQGKWSFSSLTEQTRTRFQQFLYIFDPKSIMAQLRQAFMRIEVDWKTALSFLTVFLVCQEEAAALIKDYTDTLLEDAMTNCDVHTMAVLMLVIRQSSLEGLHVFPSYLTWFKSKFGNATTTLLNNKRTVQFFMQFLSDLVPHEPSYYLKVHIIKSPQVPSKLRNFIHDYISLAKTRLMDLKEPVELTGVYDHESSILPHSEEKTEHQKLQEQATKEVEKVLDSYGKTGKVPGSVMEASIFRKPYFIGRFLPALLLPRKLPKRPDTRCKLIETLSKAGKISSGMLDVYYKACEKMAFDCDESSSEDDSALDDLEKLKKNLNNLSQDIAQSSQANEKTSKTCVSAKLSLLAGHIRSMVKTVTVPSPVVIDLVSPGLEMKTVQIVNSLLNTFCRVCIAAKCVDSSNHFRFKWLSDYVAMVMSVPAIHMSLYHRLWNLLCCKDGLTLGINHIQGLASFLCYLSAHRESPVILTNLNVEMDKEILGNNFSFVEMIFHLVTFKTLEWMEFSTRLFCAYLQHAAQAFTNIEMMPLTETSEKVNMLKSTCYVPQSLIQKLWYLMHRFSFSTFSKQGFKLNEDLIETINTVKSTALYQRLISEAPKVSFEDWLMWETIIERDEDIFTAADRDQYHDSTVLGYFIPMNLDDGGCGNSYRTACTKMIDIILDNKHRIKKSGEYQCLHDTKYNIGKKSNPAVDLVNLLERIIHFMVNEPEENKETRHSWLLQQYYRRLATFAKENGMTESSPKCVLIEHETRIFTDLITQLPAYLVFCNHPEKILTSPDINAVTSFVNNYLRRCSQYSCSLHLNITSHLLKGLLVFITVKDYRSSVTNSLIKEFFQKCPLFAISLQHYWETLRIIVACTSGDVDISGFSAIDTLHNWISSICSGSSVSTSVLMDYSPWMIASCFYLRLQGIINGVKSYHSLMNVMDGIPANKVSVCLFACILSEFLEVVLHGNEISDNSQVWTIAMEVLYFCPDVLVCFMEDTKSHSYSEDLHQLRTLVLPDKYSKLLPIVFFSLFTKCKQITVEKAKQFSQFTKITIKMNQDFAELRKLCLENQSYRSCEKPFQIEFAKTVFQFLRHHAL